MARDANFTIVPEVFICRLYLSAGRSCKPLTSRRRQALAAAGAGEQESPEEAYQRRLRESQRVEERVNVIFSEEEFREELEKARCLPLHEKLTS